MVITPTVCGIAQCGVVQSAGREELVTVEQGGGEGL